MAYLGKRKRAGSGRPVRKKRKGSWVKTGLETVGAIGGTIGGAYYGYPRAGGVLGASAGRGVYGAGKWAKKKMFGKKKKRKGTVMLHAESTGMQERELGIVMLGSGKIKGKTLGTYMYQNINQWVIQASQGEQSNDFGEALFTRSQLIGDTSNVRTERYKWDTNPYTLNPFYARPASALYTAETGIPDNDRLYIKNVKLRYKFLSMEKIPQKVTVYFLMPKYDTSTNPIDSWAAIQAAKRMGQPAQVDANALITPTATGGYGEGKDIDSNPFHHPEFRKLWYSIKTVKMCLQAGEQINCKLTLDYEKVINKDTLVSIRTQNFLKGLTVFPIVLAHGGLVGISSAEGVEASEVSVGKAKVGMVSNHQILFGALGQNRFSAERTYSGILERTTDKMRVLDDEDQVVDPEVEV